MDNGERIAGADTEIGHTLFVDIVAFSTRPMEEQSTVGEALRVFVQETPAYLRAQSAGDVLSLPTGDGMALVFFRNPLAPVQCATELARALHFAPFGVRMGIHSGPVARVRDINNQINATGSGINTAQRVMDCGEAGHILLSGSAAEVVREFATWASCLHPLGAIEVKHGVSLQLYNLVSPEVGNPSVPQRVQQAAAQEPSAPRRLPTLPAAPAVPDAPQLSSASPGRSKSRPLLTVAVIVFALIGLMTLLGVVKSDVRNEDARSVPHRIKSGSGDSKVIINWQGIQIK